MQQLFFSKMTILKYLLQLGRIFVRNIQYMRFVFSSFYGSNTNDSLLSCWTSYSKSTSIKNMGAVKKFSFFSN